MGLEDAGPSAADNMFAELLDEATRANAANRVGTLTRLREACNDILSGQAFKLAGDPRSRVDPNVFRIPPIRLNSGLIGKYVKMRCSLEGNGNSWTGPHEVTLRKDRALTAYIRQRLSEATKAAPRRRRPTVDRSIESAIAALGLSDQALIREKIEEGRVAKRENDLMRKAIRDMTGFDLDEILNGRKGGAAVLEIIEPLSASDRHSLKVLVGRFTDGSLAEIGLVFRGGRLKGNWGPESDVVTAEEMKVLRKLAEE